jgi:hypothetical protein
MWGLVYIRLALIILKKIKVVVQNIVTPTILVRYIPSLVIDSYSSYKLRIGILFYSRGTVGGQRFGRKTTPSLSSSSK